MRNSAPDPYQTWRTDTRRWLVDQQGANYKWSEYLLAGPDLLHLMGKLTLDEDVPVKEKVKLGAAIAYLVSPIDLLPGFLLGPLGALEDIALAAYVLNSLIQHSGPTLVQRHWAGEGDVLQLIQGILDSANNMGGGVLKRIMQMF